MPSTAKMLVASAAVVAFAAACTPPMPPDVLAARLERTITCEPGNQEVAVSPDYFEAVSAVGTSLQGLCLDQTITPVAIGESNAQVQIFDHPVTAQELSDFSAQCTGDALSVPVFGTPIVVAVNILGLDGLLLTPQAVAGILNGSITSWSDPIIAEANSGFDIPDIPVDLLRLEGPSGAVEAMTAWLAQQAPDAWTQGQVSTLATGRPFASYTDIVNEMSGFGGEDDLGLDEEIDLDAPLDEDFDAESLGDESILVSDDVEIDLEADVAFDSLPGEGTVAIMPVFIANNNVIPIADLPVDGNPISITNVDLPKVGIAATELTVDEQGRIAGSHAVGGLPIPEQFDIASAKVILVEGQELAGWPVIAMSSILVCDDPSNPLPLSTGQFFLRLAGQGTFDSVGLTPLPEPIRINAIPAMRVQLDNLEDDVDLEQLPSDAPATTEPATEEPPVE